MSGKVHILSQFIWPDGAPTALYAEQLADSLLSAGQAVALVGGQGCYRKTARSQPKSPIVVLQHYQGRRSNLITVGGEYFALRRAFRQYVEEQVGTSDIVVVTTAPPTTVDLAEPIRSCGATSVYWLQDYYPEVLRGLWNYPQRFGFRLRQYWDSHLRRWDYVVKSAGNLGYNGRNSRVIRNWPTLDLGDPRQPKPKTALYAGNLGFCQSIESFLKVCRDLHEEGYQITVRGDGPGISKLPRWILTDEPFLSAQDLIDSYWNAEVHLIAADPQIQAAVFPSKFWNSLASGRRLVFSGFEGEMHRELDFSLKSPFFQHLKVWTSFITDLAKPR